MQAKITGATRLGESGGGTHRLGVRGVAAGIAALALIAAGCGSTAPSGPAVKASPAVALRRAADYSAGASGERMAFSVTISSPSLPAPAHIRGSGSFQTAAHVGQLTMTMDLGSAPSTGAALGASTVQLREVLERNVAYVRLPAAVASRLPGARSWLEIDLAGLASRFGGSSLASLLDDPLASNPTAFLQYLRAESGRVQRVGSATIGGRPATEYHAVIDLGRVPSLAAAGQRAAVTRAIATLKRMTGLSNIPVDAWVDAQQRVRRLVLSFTEAPAAAGGQRVGIKMTLNVLAYGPQPAPQIPPPSQVTNITNLLGNLSRR